MLRKEARPRAPIGGEPGETFFAFISNVRTATANRFDRGAALRDDPGVLGIARDPEVASSRARRSPYAAVAEVLTEKVGVRLTIEVLDAVDGSAPVAPI
jgi:hypothetical protein